jgi:quinol monooxygenase YgiN
MACSSQSDASSTPSAISSIAMAFRKDWHSYCTSTCRENAYDASGTSEGVQGRLNRPGSNSTQEVNAMEAIGLLVTLEARPGKEDEAQAFLKSAQPLALTENGTLKWYAIKLGPRKFGIFDTFASEDGRNAHLSGEIAKALGARANELFATPPQIEKVEILASTPLKS